MRRTTPRRAGQTAGVELSGSRRRWQAPAVGFDAVTIERGLGTVSRLSFGPISALGARFQSSKYLSIPPVATHRNMATRREVQRRGETSRPPYLEPKS